MPPSTATRSMVSRTGTTATTKGTRSARDPTGTDNTGMQPTFSLPTAGELLPLLATALGTRVEGPTVHQLREAVELINEHAQWRAERADLSAGESSGDIPSPSDWHNSDDAGCDLAERAIALLVRISGHQPAQVAPSGNPASAPLMRAALEATSEMASRHEPQAPPATPSTPPAC